MLKLLFSPVKNSAAVGAGYYVFASRLQFCGEFLKAAEAKITFNRCNGLLVPFLQYFIYLCQFLGKLLQQLISFSYQSETGFALNPEADFLVTRFFHVVDKVVEIKQQFQMHFDDVGHILFPFGKPFFDIVDYCDKFLGCLGFLYQIFFGDFLSDLDDLA